MHALILLTLLAAASPTKKPAESEEACIRRVAREAGLNEFGDPKDTMYAGGSPLFDEATGRKRTLVEYVRERHPELAKQCRRR